MASHTAPTREPLVIRAALISLIGALASLLVGFNLIPAATGDSIKGSAELVVTLVMALFSVAGPLVHAVISRGVVTPVADPRTDTGLPLVPSTDPVDAALLEAEKVAPSA